MTPELTEAVCQIARLVPTGRATTYGAIARAVGLPHGARQVGMAMAAAGRAASPVPAHRVTGAGGALTAAAAFGPPGAMRELLRSEGVEVRASANGPDRIVGWERVFWDPLAEI